MFISRKAFTRVLVTQQRKGNLIVGTQGEYRLPSYFLPKNSFNAVYRAKENSVNICLLLNCGQILLNRSI